MAQVYRPDNFKVDYERMGALETAIRAAAEKYGFRVHLVRIRASGAGDPEVEIELRQQPREAK